MELGWRVTYAGVSTLFGDFYRTCKYMRVSHTDGFLSAWHLALGVLDASSQT